MKNARKKKKLKPPKKVEEKKEVKGVIEKDEEATKRRVLEALVEAFSLSSIKEADVAYGYAGGDPDKASEILRKGLAYNSEDPFGSSSSCSGGSSVVSSGLDLASTSGSSDGFVDPSYGDDVRCFKGGKQKKKVVAATGTVSTILGKEYVRRNCAKNKRLEYNGVVDKEEAEQFLYSMLGNDCELNLAVVRDVLCEYIALFCLFSTLILIKICWL